MIQTQVLLVEMQSIMTEHSPVPLIIHGKDATKIENQLLPIFHSNPDKHGTKGLAVGGTPAACLRAVDSSAKAFETWQHTHPIERRRLFNELANVCHHRKTHIGTSY